MASPWTTQADAWSSDADPAAAARARRPYPVWNSYGDDLLRLSDDGVLAAESVQHADAHEVTAGQHLQYIQSLPTHATMQAIDQEILEEREDIWKATPELGAELNDLPP